VGIRHVFRWLIAIIVVLCVVALLAWRRNDPRIRIRDNDGAMEQVTHVDIPTRVEFGAT
jgi:hypothetical protein